MRLTLRTLLAYMDGLLDSKDSQEIAKKIEASKFATELFHKIRDVMRRLRLGAPSLTERAANLDCNTVAEYLDNALPGDRVPDFEEASLKSEMHLAEVASCHQILTMVLGEPAEIDPESRQRMYQLPTVANRVDEERQAAVEAASMLSSDGAAAVPPVPLAKVRPRPVVPEYLRDPPRKSRLVAAAAIMLLVGATVGLLLVMLHQFDRGTPLGNALLWAQAKIHGPAADDEEPDEGGATVSARPTADGLSGSNFSASNGSLGPGSQAVPKVSEAAPAPAAIESVVPAASDGGNPPATAGKRETPGSPASLAKAPAGPQTRPAVAEKSTRPAVAGPDLKASAPALPPGGPAVASSAAKPPVEVAKHESSGMPAVDNKPPAVAPLLPPVSREDSMKIGRFISDGQDVLLKFEANNTGWRRVLPEEFLAGRQPLLALPSYRPRLAVLNAGTTLELINGTRVELLPDNAQGQRGVDIDFGRVVIKPLAQVGAPLRVVVGSHAGTITLSNVESIAGLEVTRVHDPGTDPEKVLSHALTKLYVARGGAVWAEGEGKPVSLTAPAELLLDGTAADTPAAEKDVPKWLTVNTVNELDQRAATSVSQALPAERAASLGLMELTSARQKEIRWLATRCLGYLGQFDPMTAALNDEDFRREWPDYIDQLKEAVARGPETAAAIRQSLEKQYGDESAALLYRMLWGYTDKDLEDGEDANLVKYLDNEARVFRVLAFENLREITHQGLYYKPEASAVKRQPSVQQWRRQLQAGRIRFKLPEEKPRSGPAEPAPKATLPAPPKPLLGKVPPAEAQPAAAGEPLGPGDPSASGPGAAQGTPPGRLPLSVPEPLPPESRPRVAFPEPQPANGP